MSFQNYLRQNVFLIELFFILVTLFLIQWKLPETKNKRVGRIVKELALLIRAWKITPFLLPDFDFSVDLDEKFPQFITPGKLGLNQWEIPFYDQDSKPQTPMISRRKPKLSISDYFLVDENDSNHEELMTLRPSSSFGVTLNPLDTRRETISTIRG